MRRAINPRPTPERMYPAIEPFNEASGFPMLVGKPFATICWISIQALNRHSCSIEDEYELLIKLQLSPDLWKNLSMKTFPSAPASLCVLCLTSQINMLTR